MSTSVRHGLRLTPGADPFTVLRSAKKAVQPLREQHIVEALADQLRGLVHTADISGEKLSWPILKAANALSERLVKEDWKGVNCYIGMASDPETGIVHLLVLGSEDYLEAVKRIDGVEEYAYWGSLLHPDHVTAEEWEARREAWDRVLPGLGSMRENMAVFNIADKASIFNMANEGNFQALETCLPTQEERVVNLIADRIYMRMEAIDPIDMGRLMTMFPRRMRRAKEFAQSGAFDSVRELVGSLVSATSWETFGEGSTPSLFRANRDRVDWMIARSIHVDLV